MSAVRITITITEEVGGADPYWMSLVEYVVGADMPEDAVDDFAAYLAAHARFTAPKEPE